MDFSYLFFKVSSRCHVSSIWVVTNWADGPFAPSRFCLRRHSSVSSSFKLCTTGLLDTMLLSVASLTYNIFHQVVCGFSYAWIKSCRMNFTELLVYNYQAWCTLKYDSLASTLEIRIWLQSKCTSWGGPPARGGTSRVCSCCKSAAGSCTRLAIWNWSLWFSSCSLLTWLRRSCTW